MTKSLGKKVLGWFVVDEDAPPEQEVDVAAQSADALVAKYAKADPVGGAPAPPPAPPPVQLTGELPKAVGGAVDFAAVYRSADISSEEQERVEKAIALLGTLPQETPHDIKKQIVEASLKAFGIPVDQIIEAGAQEIQALEAYIQHGEHETQTVLSESAARISELASEIEQIKGLMAQQMSEQKGLAGTCNGEKLRVQGVLEFFGQDAIARVVKDSPKLVEPG